MRLDCTKLLKGMMKVKSSKHTMEVSLEWILSLLLLQEVLEIVKEVKAEVQEKESEHEPFLSVQEMPEPLGGESGLYKYIAKNTRYPVIDKENNIGERYLSDSV